MPVTSSTRRPYAVGPTRRRAPGFALTAAALGASFLTACFFGEDTPSKDKPAYTLTPCVDVPASVRAEADGLVADGNRQMVDNFDYWFNQSDSWWELKSRNPQAALDKYEAALQVAPGHCQAVFGRAMASATMLTQDTRMDEFVRKVEAANQDDDDVDFLAAKPAAGGAQAGFAALFRTPPEQAAPMLVKLSANLKRVNPPTIKDIQTLVEQVIMPKLDSTIAALEVIMDYRMFAVRFDHEGDTLEIDRGEIGPGLAGLKVAKAWLTVVAGYNLDFTPDGTYDWVHTLEDLDQEDYDHLTPAQTDALEHLTGLFETSSPFSRMKPAWKTRINGIPDLLLSAVGDAQKGLESAIEEARNGDPQVFDVWRAGSGEDADVDTVDLRNIITLLERSKKYLNGEVPVEYDRGSKTIKVNFTRLFHIDGAQGLLPHFKFYPFNQWNDTLAADTVWDSSAGYETQREMLVRSGYDPELLQGSNMGEWFVSLRDSLHTDFSGPFIISKVVGRILEATSFVYDPSTGMSDFSSKRLALFVADSGSPCDYSYTRSNKANIGPSGNLVTAPDAGQGTFTLSGCRVEGGQAQYISWVDAETKGPFYFTNAAGVKTLSIQEFDDIEDPSDLKGRVILRDPTFGGVFPGQTNESFWETASSISNSPGDRVRRECRDVEEDGFIYWKCTRTLPSNPSDLDYLVYYLDWWGNGF